MTVKIQTKIASEEITHLLKDVKLDEDQRNLWVRFLESLSKEQFETIKTLLTEDPSLFNVLNKNIAEKLGALKANDLASLGDIINAEEKSLNRF